MDIFQRQPLLPSARDALESNAAILPQKPIPSSIPIRLRQAQVMPSISILQHNSDNVELNLYNKFSVLIVKRMLRNLSILDRLSFVQARRQGGQGGFSPP